ncbi:hypothetical protein UNDYM_1639 [Undibacterium sp. YM2]|nr:hypothetical protein UNDYM_1639 [Undibacterium sp. YM2]
MSNSVTFIQEGQTLRVEAEHTIGKNLARFSVVLPNKNYTLLAAQQEAMRQIAKDLLSLADSLGRAEAQSSVSE